MFLPKEVQTNDCKRTPMHHNSQICKTGKPQFKDTLKNKKQDLISSSGKFCQRNQKKHLHPVKEKVARAETWSVQIQNQAEMEGNPIFSCNVSQSKTIVTWQNLYMHVREIRMTQANKQTKKIHTVYDWWPEDLHLQKWYLFHVKLSMHSEIRKW